MIDLHQHPMVKPEDPNQLLEYLRGDSYAIPAIVWAI